MPLGYALVPRAAALGRPLRWPSDVEGVACHALPGQGSGKHSYRRHNRAAGCEPGRRAADSDHITIKDMLWTVVGLVIDPQRRSRFYDL